MYNEIEYWRKRINYHGSVNTSNEKYDAINPTESAIIKKYVIVKDKVLLEFGIGAGRMLPLYDELGVSVQGYDIADFRHLIDEKLKDIKIKYYHCISDSISDTNYPNDNFPYTVAMAVLPHQRPENITSVMNELKRITSGLIICSVWEPVTKPEGIIAEHNFLHDYKKLFNEVGLKIVEEKRINEVATIYVLKKKVMKKFEYKVITIEANSGVELIVILNGYGKEGWEMVDRGSPSLCGSRFGHYDCIFKREIE